MEIESFQKASKAKLPRLTLALLGRLGLQHRSFMSPWTKSMFACQRSLETRTANLGRSNNPWLYKAWKNLREAAFLNISCRFVAENSEDYHGSVNCRESIAKRHKQHISDAVVLGCVVTTERDQWTECQPKGVEDLSGCVKPNRWLEQLLDFGRIHVHESSTSPF